MPDSRLRRLALEEQARRLDDSGLDGEALVAQFMRSLADVDDYTFVAKLVDRAEYMIDISERAMDEEEDDEEEDDTEDEPTTQPPPRKLEVKAAAGEPPVQTAEKKRKKTVADLLAEARV